MDEIASLMSTTIQFIQVRETSINKIITKIKASGIRNDKYKGQIEQIIRRRDQGNWDRKKRYGYGFDYRPKTLSTRLDLPFVPTRLFSACLYILTALYCRPYSSSWRQMNWESFGIDTNMRRAECMAVGSFGCQQRDRRHCI